MCINYKFWNLLKNVFESLNLSAVSMIIAESSKDVNRVPIEIEHILFSHSSECNYGTARVELFWENAAIFPV